MRHRSGWVFIDIVAGTALVAILMGVLIVGSNQHSHALTHLAQDRAANRLAESELITLQTGQPSEESPAGRFVIRALPEKSPAPGYAWVEVEATVGGRTTSLVGLAPASALEKKAGNLR